MSTKVVEPGQVFSHPGTLKEGHTLEALGGAPGQAGGAILVETIGINDGTVLLNGGQTGGGFGADLVVDGTGINDGKIIIGGGVGGHGSGSLGGTGASLVIDGTATNNGLITLDSGGLGTGGGGAGTGGALFDNASFTNAGVIDIQGRASTAGGVTVSSTGVLTDTGTIKGTGVIVNEGTIVGPGAGAAAAVISVPIVNYGVIEDSGKLAIVGAISGTGAIDIEAGGQLALDRSVSASQTVTFENPPTALAGGSSVLDLGDPATFLAVIEGFDSADALNLTGLAYVAGQTTATYDAGVLTVSNGTETDMFNLDGIPAGTEFDAVRDGSGGTLVEEAAQCFVMGTRIATPEGEVEVELLEIGDLVTTLHGGPARVKWIGRRGYEGRFIAGNHLMLPVCIKADALAPNLPKRDLWVSAGHALYVDGVLVPAWRLVNGVSVVQPADVESVTYLHIELDIHDIVLAEGLPAETYLDEQSRGQFANAAEYARLYPGPVAPKVHYAERLEDGFVLDAIVRRISARAFVTASANPPGALRGYLEKAGPDRLAGWAQDAANPDAPVCLDVFCGEHRVMRLLANRYRADVRAAGLGNGCHGFDIAFPAGLVTGDVTVCRANDGASLPLADTGRFARAA